MEVKSIEKLIFDRVDQFETLGINGQPLLDLLELLPADPPSPDALDPRDESSPSESTSPGSVPPSLLVGGFKCNDTIQPDSGLYRFTGGFDGGCELSYFGRYFNSDDSEFGCNSDTDADPQPVERPSLFDELDRAKVEAVDRSQRGIDDPVYIRLNGLLWLVHSRGTNGKDFLRFRWQISRSGVTLLIHSNPGDKIPAIRAVVGYEAFRSVDGRKRDLFDIGKELRDLFVYIGFQCDREVVSRFDINVTLAAPFSIVAESFQERRFVTRITNWKQVSKHSRNGEYLTYLDGGQSIEICLYDKYYELVKRRNEQKLIDLQEVLGYTTDLTRVEFRVRRDFLRLINVTSLDDLKAHLSDIIEYLTKDWFRILAEKKIRGKENKQEVSDFWRQVQEAFKEVFKDGSTTGGIIRRRSKRINRLQLIKQACGCVCSAMASRVDEPVRSFHQFVNDLFEDFLKYGRSVYKDYVFKRKHFQVLSGSNLLFVT